MTGLADTEHASADVAPELFDRRDRRDLRGGRAPPTVEGDAE
ncbi:hypothetical protein ACFQAS_05340 [Halopenitus salinus]|uniref:Uncharacterized protein n=1 Tax=Halopenitus salinus TaxID=1198295 RepID=A0ABD5URH8_9EURY